MRGHGLFGVREGELRQALTRELEHLHREQKMVLVDEQAEAQQHVSKGFCFLAGLELLFQSILTRRVELFTLLGNRFATCRERFQRQGMEHEPLLTSAHFPLPGTTPSPFPVRVDFSSQVRDIGVDYDGS